MLIGPHRRYGNCWVGSNIRPEARKANNRSGYIVSVILGTLSCLGVEENIFF